MRLRLRFALEQKAVTSPGDDHWPHQLALFDVAHIGTLHSFCLKLVREHFHEAGLDPRFILLDEGEARHLAAETMEELFQSHYAGEDDTSRAVQDLIRLYAIGKDETIRQLVLRLHHYSQTRRRTPPAGCRPAAKASPVPRLWNGRIGCSRQSPEWRDQWLPRLTSSEIACEKTAALTAILRLPPQTFTRQQAAELLADVLGDKTDWPRGSSLKKPGKVFRGRRVLSSLASIRGDSDPLVEDWSWIRGHMQTLLDLTREFADRFLRAETHRRSTGFSRPRTIHPAIVVAALHDAALEIARFWRKALRFVFVDEYQDINAAQDKILAALAREGANANRFLVGDVKQSIYRFRLADPKIFRDYARQWQAGNSSGQTMVLAENFRSRDAILDFVNSLFRLVMREAVGGVEYDDEAALKSGRRAEAAPGRGTAHRIAAAPRGQTGGGPGRSRGR